MAPRKKRGFYWAAIVRDAAASVSASLGHDPVRPPLEALAGHRSRRAAG